MIVLSDRGSRNIYMFWKKFIFNNPWKQGSNHHGGDGGVVTKLWLILTTPWVGLLLNRFLCPSDFPARILKWVASSFSRGSSWSRDWACIFYIGRQEFTTELPGKPCNYHRIFRNLLTVLRFILGTRVILAPKINVRSQRWFLNLRKQSLLTKHGNRYCEHGFPNKTQRAADSLVLMRRSTKVMKEDINLKKCHFFSVVYISIGLDVNSFNERK